MLRIVHNYGFWIIFSRPKLATHHIYEHMCDIHTSTYERYTDSITYTYLSTVKCKNRRLIERNHPGNHYVHFVQFSGRKYCSFLANCQFRMMVHIEVCKLVGGCQMYVSEAAKGCWRLIEPGVFALKSWVASKGRSVTNVNVNMFSYEVKRCAFPRFRGYTHFFLKNYLARCPPN